jgi:uncharacterized protein with HEPN domain
VSREWRLYLDDMVECCRKILTYTQGLAFQEFAARGMVHDAVVRNLEVLGEAAKNIPDAVREQYPDVAWRQVAALRNVLAHGYFGLEDETLWDIVQAKVPALLAQLDLIRPASATEELDISTADTDPETN